MPSIGTALTHLTASEVHGIGADTTIRGTGTHGLIPHGITTAGTVRGTPDGMTLGTTAASTTLGITAMQDGMEGSTTLTTAGGTEVGIRSGRDTIMDITLAIIQTTHPTMSTPGEDLDTKPDPTECLQAGQQAAQVRVLLHHQEETLFRLTAEPFQRTHLQARLA